VQQPPEFHPEGDVWVHTLQVIDQARVRISERLRRHFVERHGKPHATFVAGMSMGGINALLYAMTPESNVYELVFSCFRTAVG
jgi:pimeloyl-ACP methyl ester carboxylesterase